MAYSSNYSKVGHSQKSATLERVRSQSIAFAWEGTLVPECGEFPCAEVSSLAQLVLKRKIRKGTQVLFKALRSAGYQICLYSLTSVPAWRLRLYLFLAGAGWVKIYNGAAHQRAVSEKRIPHARIKYPPAFGIGVLVDDCESVAKAGQTLGFSVISVSNRDKDWTAVIRQRLLQAH